jgi:PAS domain S-box-containing protein
VEKYGYTIEELIGTPMIEWIHPEDRQKAAYRVNERRTGQRRTKSFEVRLIKKKTGRGLGEATTDVLQAEPVFVIAAQGMYDSGSVKAENFVGTQGIARDISEGKLEGTDKRGQSEFLKSVIEALPHPFYVISADNFRIDLANTAAKLGNLTAQSTCYALTHKRDRPCNSEGHECPVETIKKTKQPVTVEHIHYDQMGNQRNVEVSAYPIFDSKGNVSQVIESSVDITERRQMERALKESELKFRSVAQSANDAIISADSKSKIIFWNKSAEKMFGYNEIEIIGRPIMILMPEIYRETHLEGIEKYEATGESQVIGETVELVGLKKDGSEFPLELSLASWNAGEKIFYTGIIRDISTRKLVEQERENLIADLKSALDKVKTLSGLIPICASCKKIRDDKGYWNILETYIRDHADVEFTHGICPECAKKLYPDFNHKNLK